MSFCVAGRIDLNSISGTEAAWIASKILCELREADLSSITKNLDSSCRRTQIFGRDPQPEAQSASQFPVGPDRE